MMITMKYYIYWEYLNHYLEKCLVGKFKLSSIVLSLVDTLRQAGNIFLMNGVIALLVSY